MGLFGLHRKKMREKITDIKGIPIKTPEELAKEFGGTPAGYEKAVKMMTQMHRLPHMVYKDILGVFYPKDHLDKTIKKSLDIRGLVEPDRKASPGHVHDFYRDISIINTVDFPAVRLAFPIMNSIIAADEILHAHDFRLGIGIRKAFENFYFSRWKEKHAHRSISRLELDQEDIDYLTREIVNRIELKTGKFLSDSKREILRNALKRAIEIGVKMSNKIFPGPPEYDHMKKIEEAFSISADPLKTLKDNGIDIEPELEEFRQFLAEISGKKIEVKPAAPKFKQVQREVEQELRAKGVPEEVIKATAPRLATVRYFEDALSAMDHEMYRNLGGVPVEYVKKIRNMALAKKLAAEHIFSVWGKEGIRPVLLSEVPEQHRKLIEEYAKEVYEDTERIAQAYKKGLLAEESLFNIMSAERDLADKIYEITGKLMSDPSALREIPEDHRAALRLLTGKDPGTHMIKMDRLKEYMDTVKMHLDKTRPVIVKHVEKK